MNETALCCVCDLSAGIMTARPGYAYTNKSVNQVDVCRKGCFRSVLADTPFHSRVAVLSVHKKSTANHEKATKRILAPATSTILLVTCWSFLQFSQGNKCRPSGGSCWWPLQLLHGYNIFIMHKIHPMPKEREGFVDSKPRPHQYIWAYQHAPRRYSHLVWAWNRPQENSCRNMCEQPKLRNRKKTPHQEKAAVAAAAANATSCR